MPRPKANLICTIRSALFFGTDSRSRGGVKRALISLIATMLLATGLSAAKPPNFILIISDDQAWSDNNFMEHKTIQTPKPKY